MTGKAITAPSRFRSLFIAALMLAGMVASGVTSAETRGFVISLTYKAAYKDDRNCPGGGNGGSGEVYVRAFRSLGISEARIQEILSGKEGPTNSLKFIKLARYRGNVDGEKADIWMHPDTQVIPPLEVVSGPYAYGFDLNGRGAGDPNSFEDPETGEKGVDNQAFRAIGCFANVMYDASLGERPLADVTNWQDVYTRKLSAWLFTITADDLNQNGPATVSFYKAIEHPRRDASGHGLADLTYVIDPNPRSYGTFHGTLQDGVFTSEGKGVGMMLEGQNPLPKLELSNARLRLTLKQDRSASAYLGGYQPWEDIWMMNTYIGEGMGIDTSALYHNLKRMADAAPDPETGENTAISVTWGMEAVPAFIARTDGAFVTDSH